MPVPKKENPKSAQIVDLTKSKKANVKTLENSNENYENSLNTLVGSVVGYNTPTISSTRTIIKNSRYGNYITNDRNTLTACYVTHGIIQTLIDQPVDDAFKKGLIIKSNLLDDEDIKKLQSYLKRNKVLETVKWVLKWSRLYGGGALIINTIGKPENPILEKNINEDTFLDFYSSDPWELSNTSFQNDQSKKPYQKSFVDNVSDTPYMFFGSKLHRSRVITVINKQAPSLIRAVFRGWGMSEIERLIRSINQYMKNQNVTFDLLDEAKVDVFKIKHLANYLSNSVQEAKIRNRIELSNQLKSHMNALVMDSEDEYSQKQINFAGLSDVMSDNRLQVSGDLKMPVSKLFGVGSTGFSSGEDDIENYNAMIESHVRDPAIDLVDAVIQLCARKVFTKPTEEGSDVDEIVDSIEWEYHPLRILNAEQEENVKTQQYNRLVITYQNGLMTEAEFKEAVNVNNLLPNKLEVTENE